ncbi:MAG: recombinase family protein [Dysosmobacter sp.]
MGNRKQPFGYKMALGEIVIQESEAKLVQEIFLRYIAGESLNELTESLRQQDIPYDEGRLWNKNMVARILADIRYTGEKGYPKLIDEEQLIAANEKRSKQAPTSEKDRSPKSRCAGSVAHRHLNRWSKVSPTCSTALQIAQTAYGISAVLRQPHILRHRRRWITLWNNSQSTRTTPKR